MKNSPYTLVYQKEHLYMDDSYIQLLVLWKLVLCLSSTVLEASSMPEPHSTAIFKFEEIRRNLKGNIFLPRNFLFWSVCGGPSSHFFIIWWPVMYWGLSGQYKCNVNTVVLDNYKYLYLICWIIPFLGCFSSYSF